MTPQQAHRARRRALLDTFKSVPCARCAGEFPPVAMDIHHRDGETKCQSIGHRAFARWALGVAIDRLTAELEKCEVVCANCHRIHHWEDS